jgi:hypothetical protein
MTLTTMDPKPALVVIDLQKGLTAVRTVQPIDEIIAPPLSGRRPCLLPPRQRSRSIEPNGPGFPFPEHADRQ